MYSNQQPAFITTTNTYGAKLPWRECPDTESSQVRGPDCLSLQTCSFNTCLSKVSSEGESIGCRMYTFLTIADPLSLRLVQGYLSLESKLNCHSATDLVLKTDNNSQDLRGIKKLVFESDWKACLSGASQHLSTSLAAKIATHTTWPKLWDMALGSWRTRHSCTAGSISYSHQTQLWSRAMPFLWWSLQRTISFWTLYHLSYTLCQLWVYCRIINQREHWYFCTCQAFSASCILLTLASSLLFCY